MVAIVLTNNLNGNIYILTRSAVFVTDNISKLSLFLCVG
jgi:hypothetical protein